MKRKFRLTTVLQGVCAGRRDDDVQINLLGCCRASPHQLPIRLDSEADEIRRRARQAYNASEVQRGTRARKHDIEKGDRGGNTMGGHPADDISQIAARLRCVQIEN